MKKKTIEPLAFSYPRRNLCGEFATFRIGAKASKTYQVGDVVECVDSVSKRVLVRCKVIGVYQGALSSVALLFAHLAHNWKGYPEDQRSALLIASIKKRYPPGVVQDNKTCSVIHLQEIKEANYVEQ